MAISGIGGHNNIVNIINQAFKKAKIKMNFCNRLKKYIDR